MIKLRWLPLPGADVQGYRVYRSMIGFTALASTPGTVAGLTLILKMNGTAAQTITFAGVVDVATQINAVLTGGHAYPSVGDPSRFLLRSDVRTAPGSVEIVGGTALATLGLSTDVITEKSEDSVIASVAVLADPTVPVLYTDQDGVLQDWYAVTTVDSLGVESRKPSYIQPIQTSANLCVLEGTVVDLQGRRIPDASVKATLSGFPSSPGTGTHVSVEPISTLSGPDGRYSLALLQGAAVRLEIPAIGLLREIVVPATTFAFVADLLADLAVKLENDVNLEVI